MEILGWILFGLVIGALAKLVMPGRDPGGIIVTILLGIAGALLGGFVGRALGGLDHVVPRRRCAARGLPDDGRPQNDRAAVA